MSRRDKNIVILTGNLGADPESKATSSGKTLCKFNLAVSNGKDQTDWIGIIAWEQLADISLQYLRKGSRVLIEGRLSVTSYTTEDGKKSFYTNIVARDIQFLDTKKVSNDSDDTDLPF
jgi:single-strand DNA-binding protein